MRLTSLIYIDILGHKNQQFLLLVTSGLGGTQYIHTYLLYEFLRLNHLFNWGLHPTLNVSSETGIETEGPHPNVYTFKGSNMSQNEGSSEPQFTIPRRVRKPLKARKWSDTSPANPTPVKLQRFGSISSIMTTNRNEALSDLNDDMSPTSKISKP